MKKIYLDNAATTAVHPQVLKAMNPFFGKKFGNASEPHSWGQEARKAIDLAREQVAQILGSKAREIIFTSCATESINLAHKGLIEGLRIQEFKGPVPHIITSSVEHKAVLEACKHLEKSKQAEVTYLPVDKFGLVKITDIERAIKPITILISIMHVNNEVGTIEPIREIGQLIKRVNKLRDKKTPIFFHTDATQAIQYLDCKVDRLGIDLLSLTGHKLHAPKGIGALYVRKGVSLIRQQDGGGQEYGLRSGTENVPYIVALGKAIELAAKNQLLATKKIVNLREKLIKGVLKIPETELTGHPEKRAPHIASFIISGVEGEAVVLLLSEKGVAASSGSACASRLLQPTHVLTAMGYSPQKAHGSLRFSLSKKTTEEEIDYTVKVLPAIIKRLRKMAPKGV